MWFRTGGWYRRRPDGFIAVKGNIRGALPASTRKLARSQRQRTHLLQSTFICVRVCARSCTKHCVHTINPVSPTRGVPVNRLHEQMQSIAHILKWGRRTQTHTTKKLAFACGLTLLLDAIVVRIRPADVGDGEPIARLRPVDAQPLGGAVRFELQVVDVESVEVLERIRKVC